MSSPRSIDAWLVGDSIRLGYQPLAAAALADQVLVSGPAENSRSTRDIINHFERWLPATALGPGKLVHLNAGLHDLRRTSGRRGAPLVPLDEYTANLLEIVAAVEAHRGVVVILATTTPVDDARHALQRTPERYQTDVIAYNQRLVGVARARQIRVNDLHGIVASDPLRLLSTDGVHLSEAGNAAVAAAVVRELRRAACWPSTS